MSKSKKIIISLIIGVIILGGSALGVFHFYKLNKIVAILTMDINPSIAISLNYKNEVVKVEGLNSDGKELLKDSELKGNSLSAAIEDITEIVIEKGYITEEDNHILINVKGKDIKNEVITLITDEFKEKNTECNVITQEISDDAKANAEKYGISDSKASYIESVIKESEDLTFEDLKDKSINEINQIVQEKEEQKEKEEETKKEEEEKKEETKPNTKPNNNSSSNNNSTSSNNNNNSNNNSTNQKPSATYIPPASTDRTGAWCDFYDSIPANVFVEYDMPGYIRDEQVYIEASKKYLPEDSSWSTFGTGMTRYRSASYCSAAFVELENYDKTKSYRVYMDSVTLEKIEFVVTEIETPKYDEAGAKVIVAKWLLDTYGVEIDTCGHQNFYYNIDGSTKKPEWQFTCKVDETKIYYAAVVNALTGALTSGRHWGE